MNASSLEGRLHRLQMQFGVDSFPYFEGKLKWVLTAKETPAGVVVRVREETTGFTRLVMTLNPDRVGFLTTMAFCDVMKDLLSVPPKKDIVGDKR
jgi:hypothetical protein